MTDVVIDISAASATIDETASNGASVVNLSSTGDSATAAGFTISAGNANGAFAVTAGGAVTVADTSAIDYETSTSQTVTFTITDGSNAVTENVVISFNNNAIAITGSQTASIAENTGTGTAIMTVATTGDSMAGNSWQITNGNAGGQFAIAAGTGVISTTGTALDYDTATSHTFTVSVSDGSNAVTNTVVVTVTDVNDQTPTFSATAGAN